MKFKLSSGLFIFNACMVGLVAQNKTALAPKIPIDDFARPEIVSGIRLSWDGKTMAYATGFNKDWLLILKDWDTDKHRSTGIGAGPQTPVWISNERVVYGYGEAINRDGNWQKMSIPPGSILFSRFTGKKEDYVLSVTYDQKVTGFYVPYYYASFPHIIQTNTMASANGWARIEDNPGNISKWFADGSGAFHVAEQRQGVLNRVVFRENENSAWKPLPGLDWSEEKISPLALSKDGNTLYLSQVTPAGTWGIYSYDVKKRQPGELILSHDRYDIGAAGCLIMAPESRELLGISFVTDKPVTVWLDEGFKAIQAALDKALPGKINQIDSMSDDLQHLIILSLSDRDPGTYYQYDRKKAELKFMMLARPGLKPDQMATSFPASFKSRDGLTIRGYLTIPQGREPKNLPMIVFPHDGPWARTTGLFNSYVQFLANRGYAVLQVNYRGSWGYGAEFTKRGKQRIGREVQDDITDGTRWAIEKGIADPKRIAILGDGPFSGYSALIGLERNSDLYRCAISIEGTTDWVAQLAFIKTINAESYDDAVAHLGDPVKNLNEMKDISPINHIDSLKGPVFLVYDAWSDVSTSESKAFTTALKKAGKTFETYDRQAEWDSIYELKARAALLTRMEAFLAKYMPSDVNAAAAAAK